MSNIGGARPGAGRPKGSANRLSEEAVARARAGGEMPLDFLLRVMRDEGAPQDKRIDAAKAAAPYCHFKLATVEMTGEGGGPVSLVTRVELVPLADSPDQAPA